MGDAPAVGSGYATTDTAASDSSTDTEPESRLVGDTRFSGERVALGLTLDTLRRATFEPDHHTVSASGERALYFFVSGTSRDEVADALLVDPTVVDSDCVGTFPDKNLFRAGLVDDALLVGPTSIELGARALSVRGEEGVWKARLEFADRDALVALRQFCTERDVRFGLDSLYRTDSTDRPTNALTDRQWETLRAALAGGYYEIPRGKTQKDLGEKLGISTTAVSHRLRRATAHLVRDALGQTGGAEPARD
jgi:predicted DNA binding protein